MGQDKQLNGRGLFAQQLPPPPLDEHAGSSPSAIFILVGIRASKDLGLAQLCNVMFKWDCMKKPHLLDVGRTYRANLWH
jgi:hypothetical protein